MIKGVVGKIIHNQQYGLYSFFLKGQDGLYSLGEHPPTFEVGASIQFDVTQKGRYTYAKDITPWTDGSTQEAPRVANYTKSGSVGGRKSFGGKSQEEKDYWAKRDAQQEVTQRRIEIQAARNAAIETAKFLWEKDLVAKPKKVADQYDAFLALVDQIGNDYIKNTEGRLVGATPDTEGVDDTQPEGTESGNESNWD
jgi:hypothetical protein